MEHTADVGISAWGKNLAETLSWLAVGMFSLIVDPTTVASDHSQAVSLVSRDRETLAVDWLNELLYQYETTGFLLKECQVTLKQGYAGLKAIIHGEQVDPARHHILTLAVDWLNELLYQYETTGFLLKECQVTLKQGDAGLKAIIHGEQVDPARHHILTVVKAATYHLLSVSHNRNWRATVILDV